MNSPQASTAFGHPKGLFYLFFAELWERFSFYGMKALLILYMTKQLLYDDEFSFGVFAAYGSLVYATPPIGGMLADRVLGYRKAIFWGGILMAIGHFVMAIESEPFFYLALALIIVGNGFFKPNISSFVGALYRGNEAKKDAGFTLFYLGINLGGMLAPLLCAWLGEVYGWHYGFGLAGVGMLIGLLVFQQGIRSEVFGEEGLPPQALPKSHSEAWIKLISVLVVPAFACLVYFYHFEHYLMTALLVGLGAYLFKIAFEVSKAERQRLLVAVYFTFLATLFWAIFEQAGSSITLFADRNVNLTFLNASQTNSINSFYIILLALPFSFLWVFLNRIGKNPYTPVKFGLGLILLGVGFLCFASSAQVADLMARVPMGYLLVGYFIYTLGEMCISPIGLSKVTELSPQKYASFLMGVWFLSSSYGHFFAGKIAQLTSADSLAPAWFQQGFMGELVSLITSLSYSGTQAMISNFAQLYAYVSTYAVVGVFSILVGLFALLIAPFIRKLMNGVH